MFNVVGNVTDDNELTVKLSTPPPLPLNKTTLLAAPPRMEKLTDRASSAAVPILIVFVVAPTLVTSTKEVPATVRFVNVLASQIVTAVAAVRTILPVPKLILRTLVLLDVKIGVVNV